MGPQSWGVDDFVGRSRMGGLSGNLHEPGLRDALAFGGDFGRVRFVRVCWSVGVPVGLGLRDAVYSECPDVRRLRMGRPQRQAEASRVGWFYR